MKFHLWMVAGVSIIALLAAWLTVTGNRQPRPSDHATRSGVIPDTKNKSGPELTRRLSDQQERSKKQSGGIRNFTGIDDAFSRIRVQGDYRALRDIMLDMSSNERFGVLYGEFLELHSRLGSGHDYSEKLAMINEFGEKRTMDFKNKLLKTTGKDLDPVGDKAFIMSLDQESWKTVVDGAALQNANKAFDLASSDFGEERQRIAYAEVTKIWLGLDSIAASKRVSEMQRSPLRDVAISELVDWLAKKDGPESAAAWIAEISDQTLRENLAIKLKISGPK